MTSPPAPRLRRDRCPGAYRPWPAADGLLVRLRLMGGRASTAALVRLVAAAEVFGDGRVYLTNRANLQVRGFPEQEGRLAPEAVAALEDTGLLPTRTHELIRNIMASPQTGLAGGRADLRDLVAELDRRLCAEPDLADLPGKFLFVLDDGRGDLLGRPCDLGLAALDDRTAQVRVGETMGPVMALGAAAAHLVDLVLAFARIRGQGPTAPWHVRELTRPLTPPVPADPRLPEAVGPLPYGDVPGGHHLPVGDTGLSRSRVQSLTADEVVVTPWRGLLIPDQK